MRLACWDMELFLPHLGTVLAASSLWETAAHRSNLPMGTLLIFAGIGIVGSVLAYWIAGHLLAQERGTFGRAILLNIALVGLAIVVSLGIVLVTGLTKAAQLTDGIRNIAYIAVALTGLILVFVIPMRIYTIGFFRTLGLYVIAGVFSFIFQVIGGVLAGVAGVSMQAVQMSPAEVKKVVAELSGTPTVGPEVKAAQMSELRQRQTALSERYKQLEIQRKYIPANDGTALGEYLKAKAAYEQELDALKADKARFDESP